MVQSLGRWFVAGCLLLLSGHAPANEPVPIDIQAQAARVTNTLVKRFYIEEGYRSVWIQDGRPNMKAVDALEMLESSAAIEFPGTDYKVKAIASSFSSGKALNSVTEVQLTDSLLTYLQHRTAGNVNFSQFYPYWKIERDIGDPVEILRAALKAENLKSYLDGIPANEAYLSLRKALSEYVSISNHGGWPRIPGGDKLSLEMIDPRVLIVRERLRITRDLSVQQDTGTDILDQALDEAIRKFQTRHGLTVDGIVGPRTVGEMNVPVEQRIREIQVNLERLRWMPNTFQSKSAIVNVPAFELQVYDSGQKLFEMRAIVGRKGWCTPAFLSSDITEIILNPYWDVPRSIAVKEILKLVRKDPDYLRKNRIKVFRRGQLEQPISDKSINWNRVSTGDFPYQLQQEPGPSNSLGQIKFFFPNECGCYIHDTPNKSLFEKSARAFSHGCIRIEYPLVFASFLLAGDSSWAGEEVEDLIKSGVHKRILLPEKCPVYIVYFTAWVGGDETVQFRQDIYRQDSELAEALGLP